MKRRTAVQATLGVAGSVVLGCSDDTDPTGPGGGATGGSGQGGTPGMGGQGGSPNGQGGEGGTPTQGGGGAGGGSGDLCTSDGGLTPEELLAPIQTIVVLMMENRSFDHYLGALRLLEGHDSEGLDGTESNPAPDGSDVGVFNLLDFTPADPPHGWDECHAQFNNGANDGFVIAHEGPDQNDVMGYHIREQLPITYALADASAICDHWYASVMGPTWPN